jgi:hypothetical protein
LLAVHAAPSRLRCRRRTSGPSRRICVQRRQG